MVSDFEQRYVVWKPEFVAFAAEHGRTPEEQDAIDRDVSPNAPRAAFAAWLAKRDQAPTLTPSEVALAKILAAYLEWRESDRNRYTGDDESVDHVGGALEDEALLEYLKAAPSDKGRALLDRARKAGVL